MTLSVKAQCLQDLAARCETILVADGYTANYGQRVIRGSRSVDESECPALAVIGGPTRPDPEYAQQGLAIDAALETFVLAEYDEAEDIAEVVDRYLWEAEADIHQALMGFDFSDSVIDRVEIQQIAPKYPDPGSDIVGVVARITLYSRVVYGDPYTQPEEE